MDIKKQQRDNVLLWVIKPHLSTPRAFSFFRKGISNAVTRTANVIKNRGLKNQSLTADVFDDDYQIKKLDQNQRQAKKMKKGQAERHVVLLLFLAELYIV